MYNWSVYVETHAERKKIHFHFEKLEENIYPSLPPYKKRRNHRKSYMVIYENIKVIQSTIEVYGNTKVIKNHTIV